MENGCEKIRMVSTCLLGMEGPVAAELKSFEAEEVSAQDGRVFFTGGPEMLARANLCSRFGERILIVMDQFPARTFDELFEGVKALPWERWIGKQDAFPVKGHSLHSKLASVPDCQSIIKKAVVDRLRGKYGISWFEETGARYPIHFLLMKDTATLMLDASGIGLHKRGYRANATEAPIKETLAAGMAYFARVRTDGTVFDPFCGSGTILIEAAMYALNIAPGLRRRFLAEKWNGISQEVWRQERDRACDQIRRDVSFRAYGYDLDPEAVALTQENAKKAGVSARITVEQRAIDAFSSDSPYGCVICNPPYGERLLDIRQAQEIYRTMGKVFVKKHGWSYTVISPGHEFESCFGRPADRRRKLYNGMLSCQLYMYFR